MSVEIKAGAELDAAVARAIGDTRVHEWRCTRGYDGWSDHGCEVCGKELENSPTGKQEEEPCYAPYSTDANYAIAAADKSGLWALNVRIVKDETASPDRRWSIDATTYSPPGTEELLYCDGYATLVLAIDAAILKLKGAA